MSQADLSIHGQVSRTSATEIMTAPAFSVPAKKMAMWLFIIADTATFRRLSLRLRIYPQCHSQLAKAFS